jgi:hypothetical protein
LGELGGLNLYGFVGNQPTALADLFGLCTKQDCQNAYDAAMTAANQAGLHCLGNAIGEGLVGGVIGAAVGVVGGAVGGSVLAGESGILPGAGAGLMVGEVANVGIDLYHYHQCEQKVQQMKQAAQQAKDDCLKKANQ